MTYTILSENALSWGDRTTSPAEAKVWFGIFVVLVIYVLTISIIRARRRRKRSK